MRPELEHIIEDLEKCFPGEDHRLDRQRIEDMIERAEIRHRFWKVVDQKNRLGEKFKNEKLIEKLAGVFHCGPDKIEKYIYPKPEWVKK